MPRNTNGGTEAYLAALRAYGWRGHDDDVRVAAPAVGALRMVPFTRPEELAVLRRVGATLAG